MASNLSSIFTKHSWKFGMIDSAVGEILKDTPKLQLKSNNPLFSLYIVSYVCFMFLLGYALDNVVILVSKLKSSVFAKFKVYKSVVGII